MEKRSSEKRIKQHSYNSLTAKKFQDIQRGLNQVIDGMRPAFGPHIEDIGYPTVIPLAAPNDKSRNPSSASHVSRLTNRYEEYGARFAQNTIQTMRDRLDDGSLTMALMFQSIYKQGVDFLSRTGNARWLQYHLYDAIKIINQELMKFSEPVEDRKTINDISLSTCKEEKLASLIAEIFDFIGPFGSLEIKRSSDSPRVLKREYIHGSLWQTSYFDNPAASKSASEASGPVHALYQLEDANILVSDLIINDLISLQGFVEKVKKGGIKSLILMAEEISPDIITYLYQQNETSDDLKIVPVLNPGSNLFEKIEMLRLIAILTGAKAWMTADGSSINTIDIDGLGEARRLWVGKSKLGIIGGRSDSYQLKSYIKQLKNDFERTANPELRNKIQKQLGRLMNGHAILTVDGETHFDVEMRMELTKRTASTVRNALRNGALPGGGAALLNCRAILFQKMEENINIDKKAAYRILLRALEEPSRALIMGRGFDPDIIIPQIRKSGPGHCFDVRQNKITNAREAGILDATLVLTEAVRTAIHYAVIGLTSDTSITKRPPINQGIDTLI